MMFKNKPAWGTEAQDMSKGICDPIRDSSIDPWSKSLLSFNYFCAYVRNNVVQCSNILLRYALVRDLYLIHKEKFV